MDEFSYAGKLAALAASLIWSCSITLYKAHGGGIPARTLNLYKLVIALIGFSLVVSVMHVLAGQGWIDSAPRFPVSWSKSVWLMVSGVIGLTLGDTLFFVAIKRLGAALSAALQCLTPPLNAIIDWVFLDKPMTGIQIVGLIVIVTSVAGVILAGSRSKQDPAIPQSWGIGLLAALGSAVCQAIAYAMTGELLKNESIFPCAILRIAPAMLILLYFAIFNKVGREGAFLLMNQPRKLGYLALAALIGTLVGISFLSYAFQHADTGIVSTLSTTYPIWVIPVAALFLKEYPTPLQIICTILAILGIALLMLPANFWFGWLP